MMFGDFMLGARSRLLPASVPFRFFGTAVFFQIVAWALLAWAGDGLVGFLGGPGPALGGLHAVTLGVLAMTGMGAAYQLLPVATKRPVRSVALCRLTHWLAAPGVALLVAGFALDKTWAMHGGAALVVAALGLFGWLIIDNLRRVDDMPMVTGHAWQAMASLGVVALIGLALAVDLGSGFLPDHAHAAAAHAVAGGYGFMGMLVLGFSYVLVPMFGLSQVPARPYGKWELRLSWAALAVGVAGALAGLTPLLLLAGLIGLGVAALHLTMMALTMKARMRRELGISFILVRAGWVALPLSIVAGMVAATGVKPWLTVPLFGFLLVFGWLLTFLNGVLQRIMPFLASMHSFKPGGRPALVSALTPDLPLKIHLVCHFAALAGIGLGIALDIGLLARLGGLAGVVGGLAFAVFALDLWRRLDQHLKASTPQPASEIRK